MIREEDVAQAIHSFPKGSAGGPDCLRPQHLQDMISIRASLGHELPFVCSQTVCLLVKFPLKYTLFSLVLLLIRKMVVCGQLLLGVPFVGWWQKLQAWLLYNV